MQLKCQSCGHELHSRDVDFSALKASCRHCGWQLGGGEGSAYRRVTTTAVERVADAPVASRPLPYLPNSITVSEWGSGDEALLEVSIEPRHRWALLVVIPVALLQLALLWHAGGSLALMAAPFGLVLIYAASVQLGNTRQLFVSRESLTVSSSPVPWPRREVPISDIRQLWVEEYVNQDHLVNYRLRARLRRKDIVLVDRLETASAALHLERRIEEHMGIVDVPVFGEIDAPR